MIFHNVLQRGPEWGQLRLGIPTASNFHRVLTPKKSKPSESAPKYMYELLAERITGMEVENYQGKWMERGQELEDQAIASYETVTNAETSNGGFFTDDAGTYGCSPDRIVGANGGVEIKSRLIHVQIEHAIKGIAADEARCQIQGALLTTEREWWDIFSFHPALIMRPIRVYRDEEFIKELRTMLRVFNETMLEFQLRLENDFGPFRKPVTVEFTKQIESPDPHGVSDEDVEEILRAQREAQA